MADPLLEEIRICLRKMYISDLRFISVQELLTAYTIIGADRYSRRDWEYVWNYLFDDGIPEEFPG